MTVGDCQSRPPTSMERRRTAPGRCPRCCPTTRSPAPPRAVLFGNEARGLPADILERAAQVVSIPLYGRAESLNLGTSAAVMLMSMAMSSHVRSCPEE